MESWLESSSSSVTSAEKMMLSSVWNTSPSLGEFRVIIGALPTVKKMIAEQVSPTSSTPVKVIVCVLADNYEVDR